MPKRPTLTTSMVNPPVMFGPNIIGGIHTVDNYANGAFHRFEGFQGGVDGGLEVVTIDSEFRANLYNSTYNDQISTVRPKSLIAMACIKT